MSKELSSHDHGNCELCDYLSARLEQLEWLRFTVQRFREGNWTLEGGNGLRAWGEVLMALAPLSPIQESGPQGQDKPT